MPRNFFSVHHVPSEIPPPHRLKQDFAIRWPKFDLIFLGTVLYLQLSVRRESHFSPALHIFNVADIRTESVLKREYFPILFLFVWKPPALGVCSWLYKVLSILLPRFYSNTDGVAHGQVRRKALDNIDLNQMSHRYISGVLQNEPSTSAHLIDRCENVHLS